MAETEDGNEGMSTRKKVAAGAAVGVAVPAAVAVGKKLLGSGDDDGQNRQGGGSRRRSGSSSSRSRARTTASRARSRPSSGSTKRASSSRSRSGSSGSSGGTTRTKEQLYNQAKRLKIEGRSSMTKQQLERAISRARS